MIIVDGFRLVCRSTRRSIVDVSVSADVLMLLYLLSAEELRDLLTGLGYRWPATALLRTVQFYANRVVHGSSLSH